MLKSELFNNIKNDFMSGLLRETVFTVGGIVINQGIFIKPEDAIRTIAISTLKYGTNIVARNTFSYVMLRRHEVPTYEQKLTACFVSSACGDLIANLIFSRNRSIISSTVSSIFVGVGSCAVFMIRNYRETGQFLQRKFPDQYNYVMDAVHDNQFVQTLFQILTNQQDH
ncbi:hypothetical protein GPJ56_001749 [Histomonas meleagridis]|uniref:uncharacterized protein n=1 Tax=Histomonas meleagridis TaxID=135588 RepID=UPI00355A501D|nr:hypothetical protein GPJ56_001749 [Histomonas meleagridis]KAH0806523.1 hypothetical protein GO595_000685 [Histomonas meleagridis]